MINSFSENKNITSPKKQEEDHKNDSNLRPLSFDDFVGQSEIIENLKIYIQQQKEKMPGSCFIIWPSRIR